MGTPYPSSNLVQFFPKPAVLLPTELMVVLYVTIFRLIGYKSWEWLAIEVKVERGCVARCVHWLKTSTRWCPRRPRAPPPHSTSESSPSSPLLHHPRHHRSASDRLAHA
uniref:Uncharacterized protein n=1 Tax=Oryza sativa subsp. japonica TaxID=39947 RepID=Q69TU3_ORYSJ|nr:hypothetical protein [Oryza sativa Japonica Group]